MHVYHQDKPRQDNTFLILCQRIPPNSDRARPPNSESARRPDHCDDTRGRTTRMITTTRTTGGTTQQTSESHSDTTRSPSQKTAQRPPQSRRPSEHFGQTAFPPCVGGFHLHGHGVSAGFNYTQCQCKNPIVSSTLIGDIHLYMGRSSTSIQPSCAHPQVLRYARSDPTPLSPVRCCNNSARCGMLIFLSNPMFECHSCFNPPIQGSRRV